MKKIVTFGEVMLRLATPGYQRFSQANTFNASYGGGEVNVAVSLANYGMETSFVTRLPQNDIGFACEKELNRYGVDTRNIVRGGERVGIYYLETGAVSRGSKVVYDRDNSSFATLEKGMINWDDVFENVCWFHWSGISAAISQGAADVLEEGIHKAHQKGIIISCDVNLRENLWTYCKLPTEVMPALVAKSDLIIGNEYDTENALDIKMDEDLVGKFSKESFLVASRKIIERYPNIKKIITTRRGSINANNNSLTGLLNNGQNLLESTTYQMTHIVDRVGGGDSFMGGLIYGFLNWPDNDQKTLEFALAASCLKHTISGDMNHVTIDEVENLMNGNTTGRVSR